MSTSTPARELFPIRTVASLTGVNAVTLRAWERRHGLIRPRRTAGGHRLYARADIESIQRILALLEQGMTIGQVPQALRATGAQTRGVADAWAAARADLISAIARFDEERIEDRCNELLARHADDVVTARVLLPLLAELGTLWERRESGVAEEHFFAVFLRNKLGARFHHRAHRATGPRLLAACMPNEQHEIGLLLFALAAHEAGFRVTMLGTNMPLGELPHAVRRARAAAIVLSGSVDPASGLLADELPALVRAACVPVFVGGADSVRSRDALVAAGAEPLGNDFDAALRRLRERLVPR
jgi:DNA-binding transcriptional MerR regulator/methylmalonyl-CoA mutase cobalamin-binding subunit